MWDSRTEDTLHQPGRRRISRTTLTLGLIILVVIGGLLGLRYYFQVVGEERLQKAIERADQVDAHWRWEDLQAERPSIPDSDNAALQVGTVLNLVPKKWPPFTPWDGAEETKDVETQISELDPNVALNPVQQKELQARLKDVQPALPQARLLERFRRGRYPKMSVEQAMGGGLVDLQNVRRVAQLLQLDVVLLAQEGKLDQALASARAGLQTSRSLGDEMLMIAQLIRIACRSVALRSMERILAQGQASEAALQATQQQLEEDRDQPLLLQALRGERALSYEMANRLDSGEAQGLNEGPNAEPIGPKWQRLLMPGLFKEDQAKLLDTLSEAVEIARGPAEERTAKLEQLEQKVRSEKVAHAPLAMLLMPAVQKVAVAILRTEAELRCAVTALAVERYRLANGRWPDSLQQVDKKLLARVPVDPFDGKPLRYRRLKDHVVIYSVGPDGKDDGGKIGPGTPGTDVGFRLWNVDQRRKQPPPPPLERLPWPTEAEGK